MAVTLGVDSFATVAEADAYWANNSGGTNWASASDANKEKALRQASVFVDRSYRFVGTHPGTASQLLSWPRINVVDHQGRTRSGIPQEVKDAAAYMAEQSLAGDLRAPQERGGAIRSLKAGSVQIEYDESAPAQKTYDYLDLILRDLVVGGSGNTPMLKK